MAITYIQREIRRSKLHVRMQMRSSTGMSQCQQGTQRDIGKGLHTSRFKPESTEAALQAAMLARQPHAAAAMRSSAMKQQNILDDVQETYTTLMTHGAASDLPYATNSFRIKECYVPCKTEMCFDGLSDRSAS